MTGIRTYQDAVDHLVDLVEFTEATRQHRNARRAILEAYDELHRMSNWSRYDKTAQFVVPEEYITGTIEYVHATFLVTLTGGIWPTDAEQKRLVIEDVPHGVVERVSDTVLRLGPADNPGADTPTGTSYRLITDQFVLPEDFASALQVVDVDSQCLIPITDMPASAHFRFMTGENAAQSPDHVLFSASLGQRGLMKLTPPPNAGLVLNLLYRAKPRPLQIEAFAEGKIVLAGGTTTGVVSGLVSGNILPMSIAGSNLRVSINSDMPTIEIGRPGPDGDHKITPIYFETTIMERLSDLSFRMDDVAPANVTGRGYVISDPLDIDLDILRKPLLRLAESCFFALNQGATKETLARMRLAREEALDAARGAMEYDRRTPFGSDLPVGPVPYWRRPHSDDP